jgi:hypothetical protein
LGLSVVDVFRLPASFLSFHLAFSTATNWQQPAPVQPDCFTEKAG